MIDALSFESGRPLVRINERWYDINSYVAVKALGIRDVRRLRSN